MTFAGSQGRPRPTGTTISLSTASRIVIVGAGAFGLSAAFHLLRRGYTDVTILDRARGLPAVDAASTDINKIVRSCYSDIFYTKLAREAMEAWKQPMWKGCYHECGVLNVGGERFGDILGENDRQLGAPIEHLLDARAVRAKILASLKPPTNSPASPALPNSDSNAQRVGSLMNYSSYFNPEGGWAEAARAMEILLLHVKAVGGKVFEEQEVISLVKDENGRTKGVKCRSGACFEGDSVILTTGAWTASTFPELGLDSKCLATGQTVAMMQLNEEEKERYKGVHVFLDFDSGFYTFPPTEDGIVKLSMHTAGRTHMIPSSQICDDTYGPARRISTPRTITSHPDSGDGLRVPRSALCALREHLGKVYPELAERPWAATRMCWYTDSPDGDWVIGPFPGDPTLFLATSGSGHAFKVSKIRRGEIWRVGTYSMPDLFTHRLQFLPNIGRLIVDAVEGTLDPATAARFAVNRDVMGANNRERASAATQELDERELCGPEDCGVRHKSCMDD